ncbi:MAG: class I SAM-dependent methyltransferase [Mastigocladus sp. ERB_26_2]
MISTEQHSPSLISEPENDPTWINWINKQQGGCLPATSMPDRDWWVKLWSHPEETLKIMGLQAGMSVLDLGCGYGHFTIPTAQIVKPALVVGVDIDFPILAQAQQAAKEVPNCLLLNQDILTIPQVITNQFDYITIHSTFHGLPNPVEFVRQIVSLLKPEGFFSVVNWRPIPRQGKSISIRLDIKN